MRITVDRAVCTGHGRCYSLAPSLYDGDDDGYCVITSEAVPPGQEELARKGAANCPEDAISVHDD